MSNKYGHHAQGGRSHKVGDTLPPAHLSSSRHQPRTSVHPASKAQQVWILAPRFSTVIRNPGDAASLSIHQENWAILPIRCRRAPKFLRPDSQRNRVTLSDLPRATSPLVRPPSEC